MDVEQAQREVISLYNTKWLRESGGLESRDPVVGALSFYNWLEKHYPEVLAFPSNGDRHQDIKYWVGLP